MLESHLIASIFFPFLARHCNAIALMIFQASSFGSSTTDATKLQSLRAVLENKEDNIRNLQRRLDFMEEELNKFRLGASAGLVDMNSFDSYSKFNEIQRYAFYCKEILLHYNCAIQSNSDKRNSLGGEERVSFIHSFFYQLSY